MNGLKRLRALGSRLEQMAAVRATVRVDGKPLWRMLLDIARQIEREQAEAVAWVREHGGLEPIKSSLSALELLAEGIEIDTGLAFYDESPKERCVALRNEVKSRLMPEGMEWPRYESGELVLFGDEFVNAKGNASTLRTVAIKDCRDALGGAVFWKLGKGACAVTLENGERVKRPAPKVLDADGAEIRVGDKLYDTETGCARIVRAINASGTVEFEGYEDRGWFTKFLTHRAPVLAADGKPLREGETVWHKSRFACGVVETIDSGSLMHTTRYRDESGTVYRDAAKDLTHERPDSWERIEADCMQDAKDYCEEHGIEPEYPKHTGKAKCEDLVRRAKKLAGVIG